MPADAAEIVRLAEAERECQAVWRCAIGDATGALDTLKNRWLNSRRKHEREAGETLAGYLDLLWASRDPAPVSYVDAFEKGKAMIVRMKAAVTPDEARARAAQHDHEVG